MPDEAFGAAVSKGDVMRAAIATLQTWAPTYFGWRQRVSGIRVPPPRQYLTPRDLETWPKLQPPTVMVASSGLAEAPTRSHGKAHRAPWELGLIAVVSGRDRDDTDAIAEETGVALRSLLVHKGSLGGLAEGTTWLDERYDVLPDRERRQLAAVRLEFTVDVRNALSGTGPAAPAPDPTTPTPDLPRVREDGATYEVRVEDL